MDHTKKTQKIPEEKQGEHAVSQGLSHAEHHTMPKTPMQYLWERKFLFLFIVLVVFLGGLLLYKQFGKAKPPTRTITMNKQVLQKRSKNLGYIQRGLTGKAIDVNTGKIVKAARIFSPDDKTVYLELDFNSVPKGTVIDYIRYKNGRYVDHGEVSLIKANTKNILFNWIINNLLSNVRNGKWRVATYTNGILAKRITYDVTGNKVSYVYPDEKIHPTDPDYQLSSALTQVH